MATKPLLVLNRNYVLTTTKGHVIAFEKGKPTFVPPIVYAEALAIGALPEDGADPEVLEKDDPSRPPMDPSDRNPLILAAIKTLLARNEREDFTAAGSPTVDAVTKEVGFKVAAKEIAVQWQAYHDAKATGEGEDD